MVIYGTDRWMKELITLSRFKKVAYLVDDINTGGKEICFNSIVKYVYPVHVLLKENKADLVIIISNSRNYDEIAEKLINGILGKCAFFQWLEIRW